MREGWFALDSFDMDTYTRLDDPELDVHQICPKFVAFRGPDVRVAGSGSVRELCREFKELGVTAGVRLQGEQSCDVCVSHVVTYVSRDGRCLPA